MSVRAFTPRRTNFLSFKKPVRHRRKNPRRPFTRWRYSFLRTENVAKERGSHLSLSVGTRAWTHTHILTNTYIHKEDEEAREAESGSPRCHAGCAKGDEGSMPAPFVGAIQPIRPPPSPSSLFPATQMASRRAHFISASYSRPAWRRKWKQWDTAVIRYRMLVASLNSHLYYLSASKSARASARLLVRAALLSSFSSIPRRYRDALRPRARVTGCI